MKKILTVRVLCQAALSVEGRKETVVLVPFTGEAEGPLFRGRVEGPGVDTQRWPKAGGGGLSARYLLAGRDAEGRDCRVFIENQGNWEEGFRPRIVTDSPLLAPWEERALSASVEEAPGGVTVTIYEEE